MEEAPIKTQAYREPGKSRLENSILMAERTERSVDHAEQQQPTGKHEGRLAVLMKQQRAEQADGAVRTG
jgi:hypothetical protein